MLDAKIPAGDLDKKWTDYKDHCKLVNPANKRKMEIISYWYRLGRRFGSCIAGRIGL